jgi:hypothetical protein
MFSYRDETDPSREARSMSYFLFLSEQARKSTMAAHSSPNPAPRTPTADMPKPPKPGSWAKECKCHSFFREEHSPTEWLKEMTCRVPFSNERWPNYFVSEPRTLVTTSQPLSFTLGTGPQVLSSVLPQCLETKHEVIIVTCFWSTTSQSCRDVASLLRKLSARAIEQDRRIQVRLCFSTESAWRRFNPRRRTGKIHPPKSWERLGLPAKEEIKGLNLVVKSTFVPPFSVMHPKFILMDRERAWMPSCNVSWENWFEGCIEVRGNVTNKIFEFWSSFWGAGVAGLLPQLPMETSTTNSSMVSNQIEQPQIPGAYKTAFIMPEITTIMLPSPHHWFPSFLIHRPHVTPLTTFLLHIFRAAKSKIYIQTPNLTCHLVLRAIVDAFKRGVDIHIVTSKRLMILEQLVTAGTTTELEVRHIARHYKKIKHNRRVEIKRSERRAANGYRVGIGPPELGSLDMGYYKPAMLGDPNEPVKSHLKFVCVDDEVTVMGSGNMDRASWYTSQELGIAFFSKDLAKQLSQSLEIALEDRVQYAYRLNT